MLPKASAQDPAGGFSGLLWTPWLPVAVWRTPPCKGGSGRGARLRLLAPPTPHFFFNFCCCFTTVCMTTTLSLSLSPSSLPFRADVPCLRPPSLDAHFGRRENCRFVVIRGASILSLSLSPPSQIVLSHFTAIQSSEAADCQEVSRCY